MKDLEQGINILSESHQIALEDGEIDEIDEPIIEAVETACVQPEVTEVENPNGSDIEACDRLSVKSKKHKHHKKSSHRKRQLSTDEVSTTGSWKRAKSGDECGETDTIKEPYRCEPEVKMKEISVEKDIWGHESDGDDNRLSKKDNHFKDAADREEKSFTVEKYKELSPKGLDSSSFCGSPVAKEKWGVDSDEEFSKPTESKRGDAFSSSSKNDWANKSENTSNRSSRNDDNKDEDKKPWDSRADDNKGWRNKNDDNKGWGNKNDSNKNWDNKNDDNKGWGNKKDDSKAWGEKNDDNKGWNNKNEDKKGWNEKADGNNSPNNQDDGASNSSSKKGGRNQDNRSWGSRNDDNNSSNQDDGNNSWGNRRGGRNNWGSRNEDGNNRGSRNGGRNDWRNRNDDNNSFSGRSRGNDTNNNWGDRNKGCDDNRNRGGRNRGNDDRNSGSRDNDSWNNKNKDNDSWSNKNKDNDNWGSKSKENNKGSGGWGNKDKDNDSWGNKDKDSDSWGDKNKANDSWGNKEKGNDSCGNKDKDNDSWGNKETSENKEENENNTKDVEIEEKQTWNYSSDNEDCSITNITSIIRKDECENRNIFKEISKDDSHSSVNHKNDESSFQETVVNVTKDTQSRTPPPPRDIDDFGKWGDYDSGDDVKKPKTPPTIPMDKSNNFNDAACMPSDKKTDTGSPVNCAKWDYDSDDATSSKPSSFKPQNNDNINTESAPGKWNSFNNSPIKNKPDGGRSSFKKWGDAASDEEKDNAPRYQNNGDGGSGRGGYNNNGNKPFEQRNNRNDNFNRNDNTNRNENGRSDNFNRNDNNNRNENGRSDNFNKNDTRNRNTGGGRKMPCKYFQSGTCRQGDNCTYLHDSPAKIPTQEPKVQELCRFYEHQECYKRSACTFMHEEFPCKLFHVGAKMCPSGDSCKYSHAPLNPETRSMLERYLDEKIDERTEKSAIGSSHDNSDYRTKVGAPGPENMMRDPYFQDPMQRMYPHTPDVMKYPVARPWNPMMPYGDMPVTPQMEFMQRQRFMLERFPHAVPGRMMPQFRGMMPNGGPAVPMHDPYNPHPYAMPPLRPVYGHPKGGPDMKDPYIDNLAQMVVGPKRDMLDDDADDFAMRKENECSKRGMMSPLKNQSPEVPPGAYVPRNSMNTVQPNVRLGGGMPYGQEAAMMYAGGYGGHPGDSAMLEYINMAAIHYYHNQADACSYERPWKLILLEVPGKVPYPLMNIDTSELPHKYIDPRLRGHPSVLHGEHSADDSALLRDANDLSPMASSDGADMERQLSSSFQYRSDQDSPVFLASEESFSFQGADEVAKKVQDRSYLLDPRFKRKKSSLNVSSEQAHEIE